ncbi:hypothetical protein G3O08_09270 [Cryomorpha ignava]|uniref:TerB family tellurite resistance protein n=1 Tax=Cryomorpha ignava TaxID=101383 RepID=A0A7K3WQC4_9FLAO|nr:hypothetical protein [Cryomorpha ignava]NEN23688.1 hypothetical protein [Cryomorpha ignava]
MDDKTSLILLLIKLAQIDGHVNHFEQMNIHMLSNTLGVDIRDVNKWRDQLEDVVLVLPKTKIERVDYFWRFVTMMNMDLNAHPKEQRMCVELADALGFRKSRVEEAMAFALDRRNGAIKFDDMKGILV